MTSLATTWNTWVDSAVQPRLHIIRLMPIAGWGRVLPLALLNLVLGLLPVVFVVATSMVIGKVPAATEAGLGSPEWSALVTAFLLAAGAFLLTQLLAPLHGAISARIRRRVDFHLRDQVLEFTERTTSIGPLEDAEVLDELAEATRNLDNDHNTAGFAVGGFVSLIARYTSLVAFCALLVWATYWWVGLVMLLTTLMFRYANRGGLRKYSAVWREVMPAARSNDYLRDLGTGDVAAKEARIFGLNDWLKDRYRDSHWAMFGPVARKRRSIYFYPYLWYTAVGVAVVAWLVHTVGGGAVAGDVSLTGLALALQSISAAVALGHHYAEADVPTQFGMRMVTALESLRSLLERAEQQERELLEDRQRSRDSAGVPEGTEVTALPSQSLTLQHVSFHYPGTDAPVLRGLDLELPAGRSTAIVGVNGAGKTTLVKLLTRLYEPTGGEILADGVPVADLDVAAWRRQVSVIFQDFVRYEFTAADNIRMGAIHAPRDDGAVREAARKAGILDVFEDLPLGLDTPLARAYQDGIDLSGGQWQRIAIARSLYALSQGARILVLDEPTAALDVRAEAAFFDQFVELTHGVTSILISHRFSSVRRAEHIVVVDDGQVSEQGSHDQLMAADGHYARLFRLQAERFARGLDAEGEAIEEVQDVDAPLAATGES